MSDNEQLLPAYGGCPHCGTNLAADGPNGLLTICG
jgi:hypothetical protein